MSQQVVIMCFAGGQFSFADNRQNWRRFRTRTQKSMFGFKAYRQLKRDTRIMLTLNWLLYEI